ncbi:MAG: Integrase [Frankiales bacterium]|jgi:integrase|nr:Integrase [Frankiales bacterium]
MARAAWGESSISQDASGRWHGYVSMGNGTGGMRDRRHVSAATRAVVVRKVRELERQRDAGAIPQAGKSPTVAVWLEHWLTTIAVARVRASTYQGYESKVRQRIVPALGHHRLDRLQPEHVERFYAELAAEGLASATVLQIHRVLSRALKVAVQRGRVARNVCTLVDAPSLQRAEIEPLAGPEARRILVACQGDRNGARWSVALALGLRQGEALGLRWSDVDLDAGLLRVRRALQRLRGQGLVFVEPKSRAGRRSIVLPPSLRLALQEHRQAQRAEQVDLGDLWQDHDLVFCQANGGPIDPGADYKAWKRLLARAQVRDARLHDARHTAATLLLLQGVPARVAMQVLGHSQISLTLGTYSHVVPELANEAAAQMEQALWGAAEHGPDSLD